MVEKKENAITELTAGQMLQNARTNGRRKRELQTIARQLCIKEDFLIALEEGEYNKIPELVYVLGFARNYAIELGLDPVEIVQKIKEEMKIKAEEDEVNDAPIMVAEQKPVKMKVPGPWSKFMISMGNFLRRNWKWLTIVLIVLVIAVITLSLTVGSDDRAPDADIEIVDQTIAAPVEKLPEFQVAVRESFGTENQKTSTVVVQAVSETWVKIENARGETLFSRVLVPGDVYYAPVGARATFGNAGGVDIWVDGTLAPKVGPANTRKSGIILTPDALMPRPVITE